jgi:hypothetical protein
MANLKEMAVFVLVAWFASGLTASCSPLKYTVYGDYWDGSTQDVDVLLLLQRLSPNRPEFAGQVALIQPFFANPPLESPELLEANRIYSQKLHAGFESKLKENRLESLQAFNSAYLCDSSWHLLSKLTDDPEASVRYAAISAIARMRRGEGIEVLKRHFNSEDPAMGFRSCLAAIRLGSPYAAQAKDALVRLSQGDSSFAQASAQLLNTWSGILDD